MPRFGAAARAQQARFRGTLNAAAQAADDEKGSRHGHLLALGHEIENLYPSLRGHGGALEFFAARRIQWWSSARSGDRNEGHARPTRNLASSQVSCVNFLLPLAAVPGALLALLRLIDPEVTEVEGVVGPEGLSSPVEFEWVGWRGPLEGGRVSRGANQTSVDALLVGLTAGGRRAYLIEWKYCEEYLHPEDKGAGTSGATRTARYEALYDAPMSSFNGAVPFADLLYEPFYQLMRMTLLGDRMLAEGVTERAPIDDFRVVVVCPAGNVDYRQVVPGTPLARRLSGCTTVLEAMRATLKSPARFQVVAQDDLVAGLRRSPAATELTPWLDYHAVRYGW